MRRPDEKEWNQDKEKPKTPREDDDEISTQIKGGVLFDSNLFALLFVVSAWFQIFRFN